MKLSARGNPAVLYRVSNVLNGKFYIGITTRNIRRRLSEHFCSAHKGGMGHFYRAIRKHGTDAFVIGEIESFQTAAEALDAEVRAIAEMHPQYNSTPGGLGYSGRIASPIERRKLSALHKGNHHALGHRHSDATKAILRSLGLANRDKWAQYAAMGPAASARPVVCLNDMARYDSASAAAAAYGLHKSLVIELCLRNPRRATAGGRVFRYADDTFDAEAELQEALGKQALSARQTQARRKKAIICLTDGSRHACAADAQEHYGIHKSFIAEVCRGEKSSAHGLVFKYLEA